MKGRGAPGGEERSSRWIALRARFGAYAVAAALLAVACAGTETGNPPAQPDPTVGWLDPPAGFEPPIEVDSDVFERANELGEAMLWLDAVEAIPVGACESLEEGPDAPVEGAVRVALPSAGVIELPEGLYCAVRLVPAIAPDHPDVPEALRGHSFVLRLEDGAGGAYVVVESDRTDPIVLWAVGGAFQVPSGGERYELRIDATSALVEQEFWTEPTDPDGAYRFTEAEDADFLRAFEASDGLFGLYVDFERGGGAGGGSGGAGGDGGMPGISLGQVVATSGSAP